MATTSLIHIFQTQAILSSAFLAAQIASFSLFTVTLLLLSPTPLMLRQFTSMYLAGKAYGIPGGIITALTYFYLSYATTSIRYALAGILGVGIIPYTLIVLDSTNGALFKMEERVSKAEKEGEGVGVGKGEVSAQDLVKRWKVLNLGRAGVMLGSAVLGVWTTVNM